MCLVDINWIDEIFCIGVLQNYQILVLSGIDKLCIFFNLGYENIEGIQIEIFWKKYLVCLNLEYDLLNGCLKVGENLELNYMNYCEVNYIQFVVNEFFIIFVYIEIGGWGGVFFDVGMDDYCNLVKDFILGKDNVNKFLKVIGNMYVDLMIIKGLNLRILFGVDYCGLYYCVVDKKWSEVDGLGCDEKFNYVCNDQIYFLEYQWINQINYNG